MVINKKKRLIFCRLSFYLTVEASDRRSQDKNWKVKRWKKSITAAFISDYFHSSEIQCQVIPQFWLKSSSAERGGPRFAPTSLLLPGLSAGKEASQLCHHPAMIPDHSSPMLRFLNVFITGLARPPSEQRIPFPHCVTFLGQQQMWETLTTINSQRKAN